MLCLQFIYGVCIPSHRYTRNIHNLVFRLTAYLFEITQNLTYYDTAVLTAAFVKTQLYDGTVVNDGIILEHCDPDRLSLTYNSGYFIEGLAVYSNVTQSPDWNTL